MNELTQELSEIQQKKLEKEICKTLRIPRNKVAGNGVSENSLELNNSLAYFNKMRELKEKDYGTYLIIAEHSKDTMNKMTEHFQHEVKRVLADVYEQSKELLGEKTDISPSLETESENSSREKYTFYEVVKEVSQILSRIKEHQSFLFNYEDKANNEYIERICIDFLNEQAIFTVEGTDFIIENDQITDITDSIALEDSERNIYFYEKEETIGVIDHE